MINLETGYTLLEGGRCDYCNQGLEPGQYLALTGYRLVTEIDKAIVRLPPPWVPCPECLKKLGVTEDNLIIDPDKVLKLHIEVNKHFQEYYYPNREPLPDPQIELED